MGNLIAQNISYRSGWRMEMAQFKFDHLQNLILELTIKGLSFSVCRSTKSTSCI
jgi:hypothetical protein